MAAIKSLLEKYKIHREDERMRRMVANMPNGGLRDDLITALYGPEK